MRWSMWVLLLMLQSVALQSNLQNSGTANAKEPFPRTIGHNHTSWDVFAHALLRRVNLFLVQLEINAMWYKDFFFFDYFEFFY